MRPHRLTDRQFWGDSVEEQPVHERLRSARISLGQSIGPMAKLSGQRVEWLQAIEAGRFSELPRGIYARSAVRAYAAALHLDADEILRSIEPMLPAVEDPIGAMRRLNGISAAPLARDAVERPSSTPPDWRLLVSAIIDAAAMTAGLLVLVTCLVATGLPMAALDRGAAGPLFVVMMLLAGLYFIVLGGIAGHTLGEYVTGGHAAGAHAHLDLRGIAVRTRDTILRDVYFVERLGEWIGRTTATNLHWPVASYHSTAQTESK